MPLSTRGRKRDLVRACAITSTLYYAFKTSDLASIAGVSAGDIAALGQVPIAGVTGLIVFSPQSPKPASFRKKLAGGVTQDSVTAYGNGSTATAVRTAAAAGWQMTKGIRKTSFGSTAKSTAVAIPVSNGLLVKRFVPTGDAGNAGLLGWDLSMTGANLDKLVFAPNTGKIALVSFATGDQTKTLPVATTKIEEAIAAGWKLVRPESGFEAIAAE